jgi:UDP-N-acetylglucosamine:LPS N-acetylglucosamine transferase
MLSPRSSVADERMTICLVCSAGGHLYQLYRLREFWEKHERFWVTFKKADAESCLSSEEVYWAAYPTTRNVPNFFRNLVLAFRLLRRRRPDVVVSDGAGVGVPFLYAARLMGIGTVFVEVYDRFDLPTLSGRLVYPIVDAFAVQWDEQRLHFPRAVLIGPVL